MGKHTEFQSFLTVIRISTISCVVPLGLWKMLDFKYQIIYKVMAIITSVFFVFCFVVALYTDGHMYAALDLDLILYKYSHDFTSNAFSLYSFYIILWCFLLLHQEDWKDLFRIFSSNLKGTSKMSRIVKVFLYACPFKLLLETTDVYLQYHWKRKKFLKVVKYGFLIIFRQLFKFSVNWNKFVLAFIIITGLNIFRSHLRILIKSVDNMRNRHFVYCGAGAMYKLSNKRQMEKMQLIAGSYRKLSEGVACFNRIFGRSLFLFTTATSLVMVTTLHCLIIKSSYSVYRNIFFVSSPLVDCVILIFIILICDNLSEENSEFLHSCWKLQELQVFYYKREDPILRKLIKETRRNKIRISVGGFFWIDRSLILGILSAVTTYLILLLQLKREPAN